MSYECANISKKKQIQLYYCGIIRKMKILLIFTVYFTNFIRTGKVVSMEGERVFSRRICKKNRIRLYFIFLYSTFVALSLNFRRGVIELARCCFFTMRI